MMVMRLSVTTFSSVHGSYLVLVAAIRKLAVVAVQRGLQVVERLGALLGWRIYSCRTMAIDLVGAQRCWWMREVGF
jgi:hypothetical protein